jgi:3-hydroxypropanoate dehydrogenase
MIQPLSDDALDTIFREARTANAYFEKPVGADQLRAIWDLAKWGPTSANSMPARIVWCLSADAKEKLASCASEGNAPKIRRAPVAGIVGMDMEFYERLPFLYPAADARSWFAGHPKVIADTAFRNSTLQGAYLIIAARALGYAVGPMSGFDHEAVDSAFFAGTSVKSNFIFTLGHGDPAGYRPRGPRLSFQEATQIV